MRAPAPTPTSKPADTELPDETLRAFNAWALGDPLGDILGSEDEADAFESEDFFSDEETWDSYLGESL